MKQPTWCLPGNVSHWTSLHTRVYSYFTEDLLEGGVRIRETVLLHHGDKKKAARSDCEYLWTFLPHL